MPLEDANTRNHQPRYPESLPTDPKLTAQAILRVASAVVNYPETKAQHDRSALHQGPNDPGRPTSERKTLRYYPATVYKKHAASFTQHFQRTGARPTAKIIQP